MSVRLLIIWFDYLFKRLKGMVRFNKDSKSLVNIEPNSDKNMSKKQMMNLLRQITDSIGDMIKWEEDKYDGIQSNDNQDGIQHSDQGRDEEDEEHISLSATR